MLLAFLIVGGIAALTHPAPFPFLLEAFHPGQSIWRVAEPAGAPPSIYLTFDDGPNPGRRRASTRCASRTRARRSS